MQAQALFTSLLGDSSVVGLLRQYWQGIRRWHSMKTLMVGLLLSSLCINFLGLAFPLAILQVYDRIIPNHAMVTLLVLLGGVVLALAIDFVLRLLRDMVVFWADARMEWLLGQHVFSTLLRSSVSHYERQGAGSHVAQINLVNHLADFYSGRLVFVSMDCLFIVFYCTFIYILAGWLVLVPLCFICLALVGTFKLSARNADGIKEESVINDRRINFLMEIFSSMHTVKSMAMEGKLLRRYERLQDKAASANQEKSLAQSATQDFSSLLAQLALVVIVGVGAEFVMHGLLTVGGLAACTLLISRTLFPIGELSTLLQRMRKIDFAETKLKELERDHPKTDATLPIPVTEVHSVQVAFKECDGANPIDIDFTIRRDDLIWVRQADLASKQFFINLLLGVDSVQGGRMALNNQDMLALSNEAGQALFSYLPPIPILFSGSLIDNITCFDERLTSRAQQLSEQVGLFPYVQSLEEGFNSEVSELGPTVLTPAFKEMLAITRGLLTTKPFILMDEASSHLSKSQLAQLADTLVTLRKDKGIIVIASEPVFGEVATQQCRLRRQVINFMESE